MKKILFVYNRLGREITGGRKYERQLFELLRESGQYEVDIISAGPIKNKFDKLLRPLKNLGMLSRLRKVDLIFFNSVEGLYFIPLLILNRWFGKGKTSVIHHHYVHLEMKGMKQTLYRLMEKYFIRLSDCPVTPSPYIRNSAETKAINADFILWRIPFDKKASVSTKPEAGDLSYVGTIEHRKGLIYLIDALIKLKAQGLTPRLTLIGKEIDPPYSESLRKKISENSLDVRFTGFISPEEKDSILRQSDIFVFPSLLEGYGMAVNEVRKYGLPVICFDNSALPWSVENGKDGLLVRNADSEALAAAIGSLLRNRKLRDALAEGSRERNERLYSFNDFQKQVLEDLPEMMG